MHGFWWPGPAARRRAAAGRAGGRLVWLARARRAVLVAAAVLAVAGLGYYAALLVTGYVSNTTWVLAPDDLVLHWPAALLLPDDRDLTTGDQIRYAAWVVVAAVTALLALRTARRSGRAPAASRTSR